MIAAMALPRVSQFRVLPAVHQITGDVQSGRFYDGLRASRPLAQANDAAARTKLRQLSMQLTGLE